MRGLRELGGSGDISKFQKAASNKGKAGKAYGNRKFSLGRTVGKLIKLARRTATMFKKFTKLPAEEQKKQYGPLKKPVASIDPKNFQKASNRANSQFDELKFDTNTPVAPPPSPVSQPSTEQVQAQQFRAELLKLRDNNGNESLENHIDENLPGEVKDAIYKAQLETIDRDAGVKAPESQSTIAKNDDNVKKNRYNDISPFDGNVVTLKNGTYVNASPVCISGSGHKYIATQAPVDKTQNTRFEDTTADFWNMVLEQESSTIVNLAMTVERGMNKCAQYWPEEVGQSLQKGDITITCTHERREFLPGKAPEGIIVREFSVVKGNGEASF